jgi:hypothetical protein
MYIVTARRGAKVEHWAEFPNLRDALRQLDGFVSAFPELIAELRGVTNILWRCDPTGVMTDAEPSEVA